MLTAYELEKKERKKKTPGLHKKTVKITGNGT